jgi:hypothetical protein
MQDCFLSKIFVLASLFIEEIAPFFQCILPCDGLGREPERQDQRSEIASARRSFTKLLYVVAEANCLRALFDSLENHN